jgi:hypothetical protein
VYLDQVRAMAAQAGKRIVVVPSSDYSHRVQIPDMIAINGSQYRYLKGDNEIIGPYFSEDLGTMFNVPPRQKAEVPTIGFCGWAGFAAWNLLLRYHVKNFLTNCAALLTLDSRKLLHKPGVYWRRRSMRALAGSPLVKTNFLVRSSFSGSTKTISLDPAQARQEYIDNMIGSDLILSPKGDANASVRFFEALSMGRIPLLIDTEMCLPYEDRIAYDDIVIRVDWRDVGRLPEIVRQKWDAISPQRYIDMQLKAREMYLTYLRYDAFFNTVCADLKTKLASPVEQKQGE